MPPQKRRVTIRDIAAAAGVHFTTVSLALRNHPRLPRATCERVQKLARRLGYVPDPMLASLATYRTALRPSAYRATLAWVTAFPGRDDWRHVPIFREQHAGAEARVAELGYRLEHFWLTEPGMSGRRATQILRTRNINGLLIAPLPRAGATMELDWDRFAAVAIGYSLSSPALHTVCANQYRCMRLALHELAGRGYRRIGLVMLRASDDRADHNWLAGYLVGRHLAPSSVRPLLLSQWDDRVFGRWLRRSRPDAIIAKVPETLPALHALGFKVPRDIGLAYLSDTRPDEEHSGVDENPRQVGAAAVDYLVAMLQRNERGVPPLPQRLMIDGVWIEGSTVRRRPRTSAKRALS